jgi:hypothetical protein
VVNISLVPVVVVDDVELRQQNRQGVVRFVLRVQTAAIRRPHDERDRWEFICQTALPANRARGVT